VADYLLDTSFLIDYFNEVAEGELGPARTFRAKLPTRSKLYVSIITLAELLEGADDTEAVEQELMRLAQFLNLGQQHAKRAGLMQQRARSQGKRMGENDAWIAATASLTKLVIIGDDDKAFEDRPSVAYLNFRKDLP